MRVRLLILISMLLPIFFLFALESYLVRYDQHSKYLNQLKDTLLASMSEKVGDIEGAPGIIASIEAGNFSEAAVCLRGGNAAEKKCRLDKSKIRHKSIPNIDILKGGYKKVGFEYIDDFRGKIVKKEFIRSEDIFFDFDYSFISDKDINSWQSFNQNNTERFGYYSSTKVNGGLTKAEYINGGSVFEPYIFYSNASPIEGGRIRILAISDSFGAGNSLMSIDDSWARELESQLNLIEDKYEIVVLAHSGAGYNDFLNWVEDGYVEALDPDLVLLSYFSNDFNLLHDFGRKNNSFDILNLDKDLVFYLRCFEKDDDFVGKSLKRFDFFYPSIYRYYKFSNCGDELSRYDGSSLINKDEIVNAYKDIDTLIKVPTFLYQIESILNVAKVNLKILDVINENGFTFINNSKSGFSNNNSACDIYSSNFRTCEDFKANKFDFHFNRHYNKIYIEDQILEIKSRIDGAIINPKDSRQVAFRINESQNIIADYLPNTLFVSNSREGSKVALLKGESYGYGLSSENFCVPFNRKGVVLNFNRYLTEGREIRVNSEFQRSGLGLVSRGYDSEGKVVYGEAIELKPGAPVTFMGGESVRGVVVLSNNKDCSDQGIDIADEFLLEVEIL